MKSLKSWFCLLLLFSLSLFAKSDSYAKVILTISKPAPKPALVVTYRIIEQDAAHLRVDLSVTNRQKTWYYVNAKKHPSTANTIPDSFLIGPLQTYTIGSVDLELSQLGSLAADSTLTKYKEVPWTLGIDAMYRVGMGTSLSIKLKSALWRLIDTLKAGAASDSDRKQLLSGLNAYTAALKRKDVEGCAQVMKSMIYNPLLTRELYDEDQATGLKFKSNIEKLTTTKLLTLARGVAKAQIEALSAPQTDVVTYSTKFVGSAPKLLVSNLRINEGDAAAHWMTMDVKLSSGWWQPVSVDFSTSDGTAKASEDYKAVKGTVSFSPGQTSRTTQILILGDIDKGPDKTFKVSFSKPSKNLTIPKDTITVTIADDDKISTKPSNNGKIAYERDGDIYVMNADATNKTRLTNNGDSYEPAFSPDGSKIAFSVFELGDRGFDWALYTMDADGKNQRRLAYFGHDPAFSPDGSKITFVGQSGIYVVNTDGTNWTQLTAPNYYLEDDFQPAFSPDGSKITFSKRAFDLDEGYSVYSLYMMNADGTGKTILASGTDSEFSPDGSKITFFRGNNIYVAGADATDQRQLTTFDTTEFHDVGLPTFSPDGSKIAFSRDAKHDEFGYVTNIYLINANGTKLTFLVDGDNPSWVLGSVPAPSTTTPASPARPMSPSGGAS